MVSSAVCCPDQSPLPAPLDKVPSDQHCLCLGLAPKRKQPRPGYASACPLPAPTPCPGCQSGSVLSELRDRAHLPPSPHTHTHNPLILTHQAFQPHTHIQRLRQKRELTEALKGLHLPLPCTPSATDRAPQSPLTRHSPACDPGQEGRLHFSLQTACSPQVPSFWGKRRTEE